MKATRRRATHGGGYGTPGQFFNPGQLQPAAGFFAPVVSSAPTSTEIRPVMYSTFQTGAGRNRNTRRNKLRGGFVPSVMGGFIPNAQAAVVPAALYMVYHTMIPKNKGGKSLGARALNSVKNMIRRTRRRR